jgi:hypothetical protein
MFVASSAIAIPLHAARVYAASLGREDQQAYLDKRLGVDALVRASLNYNHMAGLWGDVLDLGSTTLGYGPALGGRAGAETEFFGSVIAPAVGVADDMWKAVQNTKEGTDIHGFMKALPGMSIPYIVPFINAMD